MCVFVVRTEIHIFLYIKFDIGGKKVAGKALFALKSSRSVYLLHVDEGGSSTNFTINIKEKINTFCCT